MKLIIKRRIEKETISLKAILAFLLRDRGIKDTERFLQPPHPSTIPFAKFFAKEALKKTIQILRRIKEKKEMIVVYTDYDADGLTGGAILWETLHLLGFTVMPYVPHRVHEGYGFSKKGLDAVKKQHHPSLIISVDHGIAGAEKITYAKQLGMSVVVTDHHARSNKPPHDALAVFHTDLLSGAGVAYFIAKEIFKKFSPANVDVKKELETNFQYDYVALAAIGAIADLVPLQGATRSLVKHGLNAFPQVKRLGIRSILNEAGIEGRPITPYEVGFMIAPRLNAVGRLTHAIDALRLLCTKKTSRADALARIIGDMNKQRQDVVEKALTEAKEQMDRLARKTKLPKLIILSSETWHEGIIGLIAAKITEQYSRPCLVLRVADGFAKGSARSIVGFHITQFLAGHKELLIDVGGHAGAAGLTIATTQMARFMKKIGADAESALSEKDLIPKITVDLAVPLAAMTLSLAKALESLAPFGMGNPAPTFYSEAVVLQASVFGKNRNHLKLYLDGGLEINFFGQGESFLTLSRGQKIGVVYKLEINRWNGRETVRGKGIVWQGLTE